MEAPDKIYIADDNDIFSHEYAITPYECGSIEYIRKDALMKWLESRPEMNGPLPSRMALERKVTYQSVIDKLNEI